MTSIVFALVDGSQHELHVKNRTVSLEDAFVLVNNLDKVPVRDLFGLDDQAKDDSFHLDSVKEQ